MSWKNFPDSKEVLKKIIEKSEDDDILCYYPNNSKPTIIVKSGNNHSGVCMGKCSPEETLGKKYMVCMIHVPNTKKDVGGGVLGKPGVDLDLHHTLINGTIKQEVTQTPGFNIKKGEIDENRKHKANFC